MAGEMWLFFFVSLSTISRSEISNDSSYLDKYFFNPKKEPIVDLDVID